MKMLQFLILTAILSITEYGCVQDHSVDTVGEMPKITGVEPQPLLAQAIRLNEALEFLGSALSEEDSRHLKELQQTRLGPDLVKQVQEILDPYCLAMVDINPEGRVKVLRGPAIAKLIQGGWTSFLVKVRNEAGITAKLEAQSPNSAPALHGSTYSPRVAKENILTAGQVADRFIEMTIYRNRPMLTNLSGLKLEYAVLQVYSKDAGKKEVEIGFNVGQGSQDIGFRNAIHILFDVRKSVKIFLNIQDGDGKPAMASFTITDGIERIMTDTVADLSQVDYRSAMAQKEFESPEKNWIPPKSLRGIYPLPSRRVAAYDEYPDFFFQPQIYRSSGEHVFLPPGNYNIVFTRGPEYLKQSKQITVPPGVDSMEVNFELKRWINMSRQGWYSADHHVHAAGCSHYESPEEGVPPLDMWRQVLGEDLNIAAVLAWGPSWYHQKSFFTGNINPLSTKGNIIRYDVEVSGFPSSHAGHIVLLRLNEDDYPGTTEIEQWPSWTLPVLQWARAQGAATGYAHSGWGLEPIEHTTKLPNYVLPKMDGIGANEYVVTVTQDAIDFYSAGDTPAPWELNMWYHALNCGFRTRLSGETDFPCIFDERVGLARSYFKPDSVLNYESYVSSIKKGRSYVSDGASHIIDFSVNGMESGTHDSEVYLQGAQVVKVRAKISAFLPLSQDEKGASIAKSPMHNQPYWHIERARLGSSQKVPVELLVNGEPVDTMEVVADGKWNEIDFDYQIKNSCWLALRVYCSSHTNPVFVIKDGKPIRVRESAEWCRKSVDQCWKMKQSSIRKEDLAAAKAAYDRARSVYEVIIRAAAE
jgi:hypothetical protein